MSLYDLLGVSPDCDDSTLKSAYRRCAMKYHPDKQSQPSEEMTEKFMKIVDAYTVLSNHNLREQYDKQQSFNAAAEKAKSQMSKERQSKIEELLLLEKASKITDPLKPYRDDLEAEMEKMVSSDYNHSFEDYERIIISSILGYVPVLD